jgi:hypothetical protein
MSVGETKWHLFTYNYVDDNKKVGEIDPKVQCVSAN